MDAEAKELLRQVIDHQIRLERLIAFGLTRAYNEWYPLAESVMDGSYPPPVEPPTQEQEAVTRAGEAAHAAAVANAPQYAQPVFVGRDIEPSR